MHTHNSKGQEESKGVRGAGTQHTLGTGTHLQALEDQNHPSSSLGSKPRSLLLWGGCLFFLQIYTKPEPGKALSKNPRRRGECLQVSTLPTTAPQLARLDAGGPTQETGRCMSHADRWYLFLRNREEIIPEAPAAKHQQNHDHPQIEGCNCQAQRTAGHPGGGPRPCSTPPTVPISKSHKKVLGSWQPNASESAKMPSRSPGLLVE